MTAQYSLEEYLVALQEGRAGYDAAVIHLVPSSKQGSDPSRERVPGLIRNALNTPSAPALDKAICTWATPDTFKLSFRIPKEADRQKLRGTSILQVIGCGGEPGYAVPAKQHRFRYTGFACPGPTAEVYPPAHRPRSKVYDELTAQGVYTCDFVPGDKPNKKEDHWFAYLVEVNIDARTYRSGLYIVSKGKYPMTYTLSPRMFYIHHLALCRWIPLQPPKIRLEDPLDHRLSDEKLESRSTFYGDGNIWYWVHRTQLSAKTPWKAEVENVQKQRGIGDEAQYFWFTEDSSTHMSWDLGHPSSLPDDHFVAAHRHGQWIELHCDFYAPPGTYSLEIYLSQPTEATWQSTWSLEDGPEPDRRTYDHLNDLAGVQILYGQAAPYESWHPRHQSAKWKDRLAGGKVDYSVNGDIYAITDADCDNMRTDQLGKFYVIRPNDGIGGCDKLVVKKESSLQRICMFTGTNRYKGGSKGKIWRAPFVFGGIKLVKDLAKAV